MNVIPIKNQKIWRTMNVLKQSIQHMKTLNDPKYSSAIDKDEALLREFHSAIAEMSQEAEAQKVAA